MNCRSPIGSTYRAASAKAALYQSRALVSHCRAGTEARVDGGSRTGTPTVSRTGRRTAPTQMLAGGARRVAVRSCPFGISHLLRLIVCVAFFRLPPSVATFGHERKWDGCLIVRLIVCLREAPRRRLGAIAVRLPHQRAPVEKTCRWEDVTAARYGGGRGAVKGSGPFRRRPRPIANRRRPHTPSRHQAWHGRSTNPVCGVD